MGTRKKIDEYIKVYLNIGGYYSAQTSHLTIYRLQEIAQKQPAEIVAGFRRGVVFSKSAPTAIQQTVSRIAALEAILFFGGQITKSEHDEINQENRIFSPHLSLETPGQNAIIAG